MRAAGTRRETWRRLAAVCATMIVVALSLAATTASAATPLSTALARWHRWSHARTGEAPHVNFATAVFLSAGPREVLISGIRYEMGLTAFEFPGSPPVTPGVEVDLERAAPVVGRPTAFQFHEYNFNPQTGATFTYTPKTLATASLDMGTSIAPSALTSTFTAAGPPTMSGCRLVTGGHGFFRIATGSLAYSAFGIDTPTTPFFGTLTAGPVRAQVDYDPGCAGDVIVVSGAQTRTAPRPALQPCPGREGLNAATQTDDWSFGKAFGKRIVTGSVFTGSNPNIPSVATDEHAIIAETSIYTLPRAKHSPHGATATVFAAGDPFMTGTAAFTSTRAPAITRGHRCSAGGRTRHFVTYKYGGVLAPGTAPLTAAFDTASVVLTPLPATLVLHVYP